MNHELWAETQRDSERDTSAGHECRVVLSSLRSQKFPVGWIRTQWLLLFRGYAVFPDFRVMNVRPSLRRALENLRTSSASRTSKAYNLRGARDNVQSAIYAVKRSPLPRIMRPPAGLNASRRLIKYCIPTEESYRLTFSFTSMQTQAFSLQPSVFLSRFGCDGKGLGRNMKITSGDG